MKSPQRYILWGLERIILRAAGIVGLVRLVGLVGTVRVVRLDTKILASGIGRLGQHELCLFGDTFKLCHRINWERLGGVGAKTNEGSSTTSQEDKFFEEGIHLMLPPTEYYVYL
jgi:hypothetical protein